MKKELGKMLGRNKKSPRTRKDRLRTLRLEGLEGRRLLAGDVAAVPFHNPLIAEDVDYDFNVSPRDVLLVVNELNNKGARQLETGPVDPQNKSFIDVNGDGSLSPIDALLIVNHLNGEGETAPLVTYTAEVTDLEGNPISQVVVDQQFLLNVFVQDTRPTGPTAVFQNAIDVGIPEFDKIDYPHVPPNFRDGLTFGSVYQNGQRAFPGDAGNEATEFFNEITSFATSTTPPSPTGGVYLFFSAELTAEEAGTVNFVLNQHENEPTSQVNVFDATQTLPDNGRIDPSMISYGSASVNIIVDPTAPVAVNDSVSTPEDTALLLVGGSVDLTQNDTVTAPRTLTVVSVDTISGTTQGTLNGFTYTPPADFTGTDQVTYTVQDSTGLRSSATVAITMSPVNDDPTAQDDALNVDEETTDNVLDVLANDSAGPNEPGDSLTIASVSTPSNGGSVRIAANGLTLLYTPDPSFVGTETFTYTIEDSGGLTDTATVTVEVEPTVLPRARTDRETFAEDTTNNVINVLGNDRANDGATKVLVGIASQPANGSVTIDDQGTTDASDDTILYTPDGDFFGTDVFTYTMNDTADGSVDSVGTVTITVTDVNDPVDLTDDTATGTEDTSATIAISTLLSNDSPGAGEAGKQTLSLTSVAAVTAGGGSVAIDGTNVIYTPADDFNGDFTFTYVAADNGNPSDTGTATVVIAVEAVNDDPIAGADSSSTAEDTTATIATSVLLQNDSPGPANENSQTLSVSAVAATSSAGGTVTLNGDNVLYSPPADFNGSDEFTYTVLDSLGASATGTVTIAVSAVNDPPIAGTDSVRAFKNNPQIISIEDLLENDSTGPANESGQVLSIVAVTATASTNGTVVLNNDGTITYTPGDEYTGDASFEYTLQDNGGGNNQSTGTVNVTVEEFLPTTISGTVWMDENNDGSMEGYDIDGDGAADIEELRVGGVHVTITGVSLGQTIESQTIRTLSDGSYHFENLGPGQYVISFSLPEFTIDGQDIPGPLGDADSAANQFTVNVAEPGGADASGYNFGVLGIESRRARILDQLASRYSNGTDTVSGAFFSLGSDNSLQWSSLLAGFEDVSYAEAVLSNDGSELIMTIVDSAQDVYSTVLDSTEFVKLRDAEGNYLVRVLGTQSQHDWTEVSLGTPPIMQAANYLAAIDEIFEQEDWGM